MSRLGRLVASLAVLAVLVSGCGMLRRGSAAPDLVRLTLLHINDAYTLEPVDNGRRGGMARLATLARDIRAKNPNTLFVHGGDFLSPSLLSTYLKGRQMIAALDQLGMDAVTFGNHEFDFGPGILAERMRDSRFAWISSNVRDRKTGGAFANAQHDRLVSVGGIRVGLLGLTLPETANIARTGPDIVFDDPLRTGIEAATALRRRGAQVVIALTHQEMRADRALGEKAPIDVIAGGHEHEPLVADAGNAIVLKAGSDARYLVQLDLWLTRDGKLVERSWTFHEVSARIAPDPAMERLIARYAAELERELAVPVGRSEVALDARRQVLRTQEAAIGNFVADVMREALQADVALMNGGGLRGDKIVPPGPLLRRDVHTLVPFNNSVVKLEMTGTALRQALEHGLSQADNQGGGFLHVSGIQVTYDARRPAGSRILTAEIAGRPVDPASLYTVATIDYVATGGDGQTAFRDARTLLTATNAPDLPTLVLRAVETRRSIAPRVDNRLRATTPPRSSRDHTDVGPVASLPRSYTDSCAREDRTVAGHFA